MAPKYSGRDDRRLEVIDPQIVLAEYGPMRMQIQAMEYGRPLIDLAMEGGRVAFGVLEDLAHFLPMLKRKAMEIEEKATFPEVVRNMIKACKKMEAQDLTPLASVAGASSDVVADFLIAKRGTKIIVDNGGDIAIRLKGDEQARSVSRLRLKQEHQAICFSLIPEWVWVELPRAVWEEEASPKASRQPLRFFLTMPPQRMLQRL